MQIDTPYLELDLAALVRGYRALRSALPVDELSYAVCANPHSQLLAALHDEGAHFVVASPREAERCLRIGARATDVFYSHPVKRRDHVVQAAALGVELFVADSPQEVIKLATAAPGRRVLVRLSTTGEGSDWPLSRKYGCSDDEAVRLLELAGNLGLHPEGVAFQVGPQQRRPSAWRGPIKRAARIFSLMAAQGLPLSVLAIGGGFASEAAGRPMPSAERYGATIRDALRESFPGRVPWTMAEPGRGISAGAGRLVTTVVEVLERGSQRWVFLDAGVHTGLTETGEALRHRLRTNRDGGPTVPCVLAGPTSDTGDVLYAEQPVHLPIALTEGDTVVIESTGAYTVTHSSVGFNGFDPLPVRVVNAAR